ncbi:MAG: GHKL domain-containing protein [Clostridia bacterium]|nr:GHKL domain-containing protein [Clostridia bacterium]
MIAMAAELFANLFDSILQTYFILSFIKQPFKKNKHFLIFIAITFVALSISSFYTVYSNAVTVGYITLSYLFTLPIKEAKLSARLMAPALFIIIISTTNLIIIGILHLIFDNPDAILIYGTPERYTLIAMSKILLTLFTFLIRRLRRLDISLRPVEVFTYGIFPLVSFTIVANFCILIRDHGLSTLSPMTIFCMVGLVVMNFVIMFLFERITTSNKEKTELKLLQAQAEYEKEKYTELQGLYEQVRAVRHDFSNHIITLSNILDGGDMQAAKDYVANLGDSASLGKVLISSGNRTLDFIINSKMASNEDIKFSVIGSVTALPDSDPDLTVLIGNILDNAITAARQSAEKTVELRFYQSEYYQNIFCKNSVKEPVLKNNPKLLTTKGNGERHGLGIKSIRSIVERYSGLLDFYEEDGRFCAQISLPICEMKKTE